MKNVFDNTTTYDSVAPLGERHLDRVEVAGSSPVGIIAKPEFDERARVFYVCTVREFTHILYAGKSPMLSNKNVEIIVCEVTICPLIMTVCLKS